MLCLQMIGLLVLLIVMSFLVYVCSPGVFFKHVTLRRLLSKSNKIGLNNKYNQMEKKINIYQRILIYVDIPCILFSFIEARESLHH